MRVGRIGSAATLAGYLVLATTARADAPPKAPPPEDSFLEFLGQDDVEDAKWWEFFREESKDPPPTDGDEKT